MPQYQDNTVHLALALHDKSGDYSQHLGVCICSAIANTSVPLHVHLLHDETLSASNRHKFEHIAEEYGHRVEFHDISGHLAAMDLSAHANFAYVSPATLGRLFLPEVLPELSRVLYLDADIVVDMNLSWVNTVDMQGAALGAVPDLGIQRALYVVPRDASGDAWASSALGRWLEEGVPLAEYFNAGVLLLDLDKLRENRTFAAALHIIATRRNLPCSDQDALNMVFGGVYHRLPFCCNVMLSLYPTWNEGPCIWHFTGNKPWNDIKTIRAERYRHYQQLTPWQIRKNGSPKYAPIAYICFNRPQIVNRTLKALCDAALAKESDLHIFIDGPRGPEDVPARDDVRQLCFHNCVQDSFASVTCYMQESNIGCAGSVKYAIEQMCKQYDRFILFEDDILCSPQVLVYFNKALDTYKDMPSVFTVSGWRPPQMNIPENYPWDAFFCPRSLIWGWASWADRMKKVDWEAGHVWELLKNPALVQAFNRGGDDMAPMLNTTMHAEEKGWDIVMDFSRFRHGASSLSPCSPFTMNIGADVSSIGSASVNLAGQTLCMEAEQIRLPEFVVELPEVQQSLHRAWDIINNIQEQNPAPQNSEAKCPLCGGTQLSVEEELPAEGIVQLYLKEFGLDVSSFFADAPTVSYHRCQACDLRFFTPACPGDEAMYHYLASTVSWYYMDDRWEYEVARKWIHPGTKVLEVGCGKGAFSRDLPCAGYTGLELSPGNLPLSAENRLYLKEDLILHALSHAEQYDVACAFQVLEHIPDAAPFVEAMCRTLKPGGILVLSVPNADSYYQYMTNHALNMPPHHATHWPEKTFSALARLFDCTVVGVEKEPLLARTEALRHFLTSRVRQERGLKPTPVLDLGEEHQAIADEVEQALPQLLPQCEEWLATQPGAALVVILRKNERNQAWE